MQKRTSFNHTQVMQAYVGLGFSNIQQFREHCNFDPYVLKRKVAEYHGIDIAGKDKTVEVKTVADAKTVKVKQQNKTSTKRLFELQNISYKHFAVSLIEDRIKTIENTASHFNSSGRLLAKSKIETLLKTRSTYLYNSMLETFEWIEYSEGGLTLFAVKTYDGLKVFNAKTLKELQYRNHSYKTTNAAKELQYVSKKKLEDVLQKAYLTKLKNNARRTKQKS